MKAALEQTPGVRVERDPKATNTVRVYLSRGDLTEYQARKLATETRARLGANAIVYIKDDTGRTLAKAAAWGVSN